LSKDKKITWDPEKSVNVFCSEYKTYNGKTMEQIDKQAYDQDIKSKKLCPFNGDYEHHSTGYEKPYEPLRCLPT
jgi:hypothetical protein